METGLLFVIIIVFICAFACGIISIFSFNEKDFLFNNAYLYASEYEREHMDKKPYYRQSAIVFLLLSIMFTVLGILILFNLERLIVAIIIPLIIITVLFAIISTIKIG
ncbi:MAG: DUF3784 domain-containing protein [Eubacterium sp.]|nr:DUF3784 domain-containing protein [Eubacterium sp.]